MLQDLVGLVTNMNSSCSLTDAGNSSRSFLFSLGNLSYISPRAAQPGFFPLSAYFEHPSGNVIHLSWQKSCLTGFPVSAEATAEAIVTPPKAVLVYGPLRNMDCRSVFSLISTSISVSPPWNALPISLFLADILHHVAQLPR
jgi:hypothetical protein